jgi:hypothetical protein
MDEAPREVMADYLTRTKQWSGSAPMTLPVLQAEARHRLMRKKLAKAPKHLREGTPEYERVRNQLYGITCKEAIAAALEGQKQIDDKYGNLPEPQRLCGTSET